jgi:hypothetical protein
VTGNTYPEDRGSSLGMNLGCRNMLGQREKYGCRTSAIRIQAVQCWLARLGMVFLARSTTKQSYRMSENYRSELRQIQGNQENQPGVTKYRMSMPVAAVAKAEKAASHSHTAAVEERDD